MTPPRKSRDAPRQARPEGEDDREHGYVRDGPRRGDGVELVRVVEHRRLGRARRARVVVEATACRSSARTSAVERLGALLDQPQPEVDVAEQPPLVGRRERRRRGRARACGRHRGERGREQQVGRAGAGGAAPSRGRSSPRRPCARAARPRRRGGRPARRQRAQPRAHGRVRATAATARAGPDARSRPRGTRGSRPARRRRGASPGASAAGSASGGLERAHVELQPVAEALDAAEHAHGVALGEARVEQLDVVPDPRLDAPARVDELEREVRRRRSCPQPPLARDRVDALDDAVLGELGDRGHRATVR